MAKVMTREKQKSSNPAKVTTRYNQSKVYSWQAQNKSALDLLNDYYKRINAGEWLSNEDRAKYKSAIDTYTSTGNALRDVSKFYGTKYTDDEEKSWQNSLASLNQGYTSVNDFYGQFADENQYNLWSRWEKPVDDVDYEKYVQTGKGSVNPSWQDTRKKLFGDPANVNNMVTFAENNAANAFGDALQGLRAGASGYTHTNLVNLINQYMTDEEKSRYNYYIGKGDTATAQEYLSYIENELNKRAGGEISKQVDSTVWEPFFAFGSGMQSGIYGIDNAVRGVLGKEGVSTSPLQYANSYSNENNKGAWKVINDLANTTGNMAPSLVIGAINPTAGAVTMGISAGGNAYSEMLQQGYSVNQARAYGVMTGASEAVLSKVLGGISKLGGNGKGVFQSLSSKVLPGVNNAIGRVAIQLGGNMADEALEEGVQTYLDPVFKWAATLGEAEREKVNWEEVGYSALLGGLSAGLLEGTPTIANAVSTNLRTQKAFGSQAQNIVADALEINPNDKLAVKAQTAINKGKQVSGLTLDALLTQSDTAKVKEAVTDRLTELGERGNVAKISDAITKQTVGEELSLKESNLLKNSQYAQRVMNELDPQNINSGQFSSKWAESIGTKRLNANVYNRTPSVKTSTNTTNATNVSNGTNVNKPSIKLQTNDGKTSEIGTIKSVEGDVATVELSDGTVAKVGLGKNTQSEVKFNDAKTEEMFKIAAERVGKVEGWTVESANAMVKGYTGQIPVSDYVATFEEAYKLGMNGAPTTEVVTLSHNTEGINQSTLLAAYDIGRQANENSVLQTAKQSDIINTESEALTNEGTSEGAGIHLRRGSEWNDGAYPQEQVSRLDSRPRTNQTWGEGSRPADSEAINLANEGREVRVAELGILNGSKTQTVRLVDANKETTAMKKARKDAESRGLKIKFFVGDNIAITEKTGEISAVRAYVLGDTMLVRADHPVYTADQLERHEAGHVRIERGEINQKDVRKGLEEIVGKEAVEGVVEQYAELYASTGMTAEEIWEECICDFLGDINIFSKSANGSLVVKKLINQTQAITKEQKAEPNQTRGSPDAEGKASREISTYTKQDYERYGWAREAGIISFNNMSDLESKLKVKNSLKDFPQSMNGEAIVAVNDHPNSTLEVNNTLLYVVGSRTFPKITKVVKINLYNETDIELVERNIYESEQQSWARASSFMANLFETELIREYSPKDFPNYQEYKNKSKQRGIRSESERDNGDNQSFSQRTRDTSKNKGYYSRELDSLGNELTEEQAEFFKDSKVRDAEGNLLVMYHGTRTENGEFWEFDYNKAKKKGGLGFKSLGQGNYFTSVKLDGTELYGSRVIEAYLSIKSPLIIKQGSKFKEEVSKALGRDMSQSTYPTIQEAMRDAEFDGVILLNEKDEIAIAVTFDSNQIKQVSNKAPTSNLDIRYSRELDVLDYITPEDEFEGVDEMAFSNRTLLANALLDTITSSEEYKLIRSYQEEIAKLDAGDKRLAQLKKDLNQLYKQEKPNLEVIRELREKITALESEIVNRDKRLLRLESTTVLKNVLERARKDAYAKAMQKGKETMHRAVERRYETIERNKAKKTAHELEMLLNKNDKKRNVKLGEQAIVRAALDLSNMYFTTDDDLIMNGIQTPALDRENDALAQYRVLYDRLHATDGDVTNHKEERTQLRHEMNEVKKGLRDLLERERKRINNTYASSIYDAVINEYQKLQSSPDAYVSKAFDANVLAHLKKLKTDLGSKLISEMTLEDLKNVNNAFSMIKHMVVNSNKMFREGRSEDIQERSIGIFSDVSKVGKQQKDRAKVIADKIQKIDKLGWDNLRPVDVFELIGSAGLTDLFWDAVSAQDVYARDVVEYQNALEKARRKYGYKNWEFKPVTTFKTADGKELNLTLGEMMSIYAYSKRAQADEHLRKGGIQFKKNAIYKDKKGVERERSGKEYTYLIDDALRLNIISKLTQEQRAYVEEMQKILTDWGQKGNEVTRVLYGIDLFNEKNYFPLRSSHDYLPSANTQLGQTVTTASLVGSAFAKSTVPHANNPIILDSFDAVVHDHIDRMSKYHAYVIPIENLRKILDAQITDSSGQIISLKSKISSRLGDGAVKYLEQYITDLNGGVQQGYDNGLMGFFGKAKGAMVAANLSVWVQQYFSVIRAMNEINPTYFAPVMGESYKHPDMKLYAEMKKYAPITVIKEMGGFDVGTRGSVEQYVGFDEAGLSREKVSQKMQDAFGVGANVMDKLGWMTIWKAVKKEVAATNQYKLGSEEFYKACGKRMNEVITKTQVYDSVNARSGNMRKNRDWWKMATSFLGEPTTIAGMATVDLIKLKRAISTGNKEAIGAAIGKFAGTMVTISISTAMTSIFKSLIYAMRDDDEDETYWEKYAAALAGAFRDDINLWGYYPLLRDFKSMWQGYTIERPDMQLFEDAINSYKKLFIDKDEEEPAEQTFEEAINFMGSIANIFSIPMKNIVRDLRGLYNTVTNIGNGYETNLKDAIKEGYDRKENTKSYNIYVAELRGDTNRINYYKSSYEDNSKYYSALRKAIRENDPRVETAALARLNGDNDTYYNLMYDLIEEGHFDSDLIKEAFEAEYKYLQKKNEEAEDEE